MNSKIIAFKRLKKGCQKKPHCQGSSLELSFYWMKAILFLSFSLFVGACHQTLSLSYNKSAISVTPSVPSANNSTFTTSATVLPPDNTTTATLTATIKDASGNPISGNVVTFSQVAAPGSITPTLSATTATTSSSGAAVITIKASTSGFATISASTSGTVITLPSLTIQWTAAPSIGTTPGTYNFITSNAPPINVINTAGAITSCTITPSLPASFIFNTKTCQISPVLRTVGTPMRSSYTITATNALGSSSVNINLAAFFYSDRNSDNMCGWNAAGKFVCWGGNYSGELGDGTSTSRMNAAVTTAAATQGVNAVVQSTGDAGVSTCALTSSGAVYCTGGNGNYNLGNGGTSSSQTFIQIMATPNIVQLKNSWWGYCALASTGGVYCWGTQLFNNCEFGPSTSISYATPTIIQSLSGIAIANIGGADRHTCAITTSGSLICWGLMWQDYASPPGGPNQPGAVPSSYSSWETATTNSPTTLTGFANPIQMSSGGEYTLFLNAAGQVAAFGDNVFYQLAATGGDQVSPALTTISTLSSVVQICATGLGYNGLQAAACALFGNGSVSCWGSNSNGQLGQGGVGSTLVSTPTAVSAITNAVALFGTGNNNMPAGFCALLSTGSYVCWGYMYADFNMPAITSISGLP